MSNDNNNTSIVIVANENGMINLASLHLELSQYPMQLLVPAPATLLKPIQRLLQPQHFFFMSLFDVSRRLLHIYDLIVVKNTIQVCRFDVQMMDLPVISSG